MEQGAYTPDTPAAIIYKASTEVSYKQGGQPIRITLAVKEFFMRDFNGRSGATVTVKAGAGCTRPANPHLCAEPASTPS